MSTSRFVSFTGICLAVLAYLFAGAFRLGSHDLITTNLTFTRDVSRILNYRCVACHDSHSNIPLTSYEEVRPWAVAIKDQVLARTMPPWGAVKGFGNLMPDGGLNQEEITIIAAWVVGGAPRGDPALLEAKASMSRGRAALPVEDALMIDTKGELKHDVWAAGVRPIGDTTIPSAKVIARLPSSTLR